MKGLTIFLTGLAAGATLGLLLAPEKGSVSRERLRRCLRQRGLLPVNEIDILVEEIQNNPGASFGDAVRPQKEDETSLKN